MKRPSYAGSRLEFDVDCYRNDRANGLGVMPSLWACVNLRGRLGWRINDLGVALMNLSRKLCSDCPSLDNPTMETALSMCDHYGVTIAEVAQLGQAKRLQSAAADVTVQTQDDFWGDPADHTPEGAAFIHLGIREDGRSEVVLISGTDGSVPTRSALMATLAGVSE